VKSLETKATTENPSVQSQLDASFARIKARLQGFRAESGEARSGTDVAEGHEGAAFAAALDEHLKQTASAQAASQDVQTAEAAAASQAETEAQLAAAAVARAVEQATVVGADAEVISVAASDMLIDVHISSEAEGVEFMEGEEDAQWLASGPGVFTAAALSGAKEDVGTLPRMELARVVAAVVGQTAREDFAGFSSAAGGGDQSLLTAGGEGQFMDASVAGLAPAAGGAAESPSFSAVARAALQGARGDVPEARTDVLGSKRAEISMGEGAEHITLKIYASGAHVRVTAVLAAPEILNQLQGSLEQLTEALAQHGLELDEFSSGPPRDEPGHAQPDDSRETAQAAGDFAEPASGAAPEQGEGALAADARPAGLRAIA